MMLVEVLSSGLLPVVPTLQLVIRLGCQASGMVVAALVELQMVTTLLVAMLAPMLVVTITLLVAMLALILAVMPARMQSDR